MKVTRVTGERAEEVRRELQAFQADIDRFLALRDELLERYPEEWVTVHGDHVYHAPDLGQLFKLLREAGIDPAVVPREFLTRDDRALIL